jgi:hypothetical protein
MNTVDTVMLMVTTTITILSLKKALFQGWKHIEFILHLINQRKGWDLDTVLHSNFRKKLIIKCIE